MWEGFIGLSNECLDHKNKTNNERVDLNWWKRKKKTKLVFTFFFLSPRATRVPCALRHLVYLFLHVLCFLLAVTFHFQWNICNTLATRNLATHCTEIQTSFEQGWHLNSSSRWVLAHQGFLQRNRVLDNRKLLADFNGLTFSFLFFFPFFFFFSFFEQKRKDWQQRGLLEVSWRRDRQNSWTRRSFGKTVSRCFQRPVAPQLKMNFTAACQGKNCGLSFLPFSLNLPSPFVFLTWVELKEQRKIFPSFLSFFLLQNCKLLGKQLQLQSLWSSSSLTPRTECRRVRNQGWELPTWSQSNRPNLSPNVESEMMETTLVRDW